MQMFLMIWIPHQTLLDDDKFTYSKEIGLEPTYFYFSALIAYKNWKLNELLDDSFGALHCTAAATG